MADFKLNPDSWDIEFTSSGDIEIIEGPQETNQNSKFRLQIIQGEMFDDTRQGVPWLTDMVNPELDISAKKRILERVILSTPGALRVTSMEVGADRDGLATARWEGICDNGERFGDGITFEEKKPDPSQDIYAQSKVLESSVRAWQLAGYYYSQRMLHA
ncbi:MAG: hypothetical protein ACRCUK_13160 [Plesiomonas shigelloides]